MHKRGTEAPVVRIDYEAMVGNALVALYQPTDARGEDFFKAVARMFGLDGREARLLLEQHGYDPFVRVLKSFRSYPYTRADPAGGADNDP